MSNRIPAPGAFRQSLQEKIRKAHEEEQEEQPAHIKNTDPNSFSKIPTWYHAKQNVPAPAGGSKQSPFPKNSPLTKPVHERMKTFVRTQFGGKK